MRIESLFRPVFRPIFARLPSAIQQRTHLLGRRTFIDIPGPEGTPLHVSVKCDLRDSHYEICKVLLKTGKANPLTVDDNGETPLDTALRCGSEKMIELLKSHHAMTGAQLNSLAKRANDVDKNGQTSLHRYAKNNTISSYHVCKWLLDNNANPNIVDQNGETALDIAKKNGFVALIELLKSQHAMTGAQVRILQEIMDKKNEQGLTPLHLFVSTPTSPSTFKMSQWLLKNGANPNTIDKKGETPLDTAKRLGWNEMVQLLERYNAMTCQDLILWKVLVEDKDKYFKK